MIQTSYVYYNRQYREAGVKSEAYSVPAVRYKTLIISVLGILFAGAAAYYSSTLYSLNTIITDADQLITAMSSFNSYSDHAGDMIEQAMDGHCLGEAKSISSFLSSFPEYQNKTHLSEIANIYGANSVITYSMSNEISGLNVYSVTSILITIVVGVIIVSIILAILTLLAQLLQPRGETIKSTIELFSILIILCICLARLGFDIKTLVASAGLMGLVIGMGARDLITDILAGLFIIFEGDFQVGDIIDIGNFSGMVKEIGIRTTKIVSWNRNIKIVNNRNLSSVVNLSERNSIATVDFSVPNSVDAEQLEAVLNSSLAELREKYPQLLPFPFAAEAFQLIMKVRHAGPKQGGRF